MTKRPPNSGAFCLRLPYHVVMAWLIIGPILVVLLLLVVLFVRWVYSDESDHVHDIDAYKLAKDPRGRIDRWFSGS